MDANRKLVYTVITGDYDTLRPIRRESGFDYVCFTDNPGLKKKGWDLKTLKRSDSPVRQQRLIKILSHQLEYDLTVYMDANFRLYRTVSSLIKTHYIGGFLTCLHDARTLVSEEMDRILELRKDTPESIQKVKSLMETYYIPDNCGMYANGFIIRDNSFHVKILEKQWADLLNISSHRDQLTLGPASYFTGIKINTITRMELRKYAKLEPHKKHENPLFKSVQR